MAKVNTIKIQDGDGFQVINSEDYDEKIHKPVVGDGEIIVKPLGVEGAKPFIIDEKDFDGAAYERVNATAANVAEVAKQTDRQTLAERLEDDKSFVSVDNNEFTREYDRNIPKAENVKSNIAKTEVAETKGKVGDIQTPQKQLRRNQKNKK